MSDAAERHRRHADDFSRLVAGVPDWDAPTPVREWTARDVVGHLVEWLPGLLAGGSDVRLPAGPAVADDPVAAWTHHAVAVQALLDDPATAGAPFAHPQAGEDTVAGAIDRFYTTDVHLHAWDLARASGQDSGHDPDADAATYAEMSRAAEMIRASGQFGEQQPVPPDADGTDRLMAFLGRDPRWTPPSSG